VKGLNRGVIKLVKGSIKTAGLDRDSNGIIIWHNIEGTNALTSYSLHDLSGRNITFHSIGTAANPFVLDVGKSLATANSISFTGTNHWNGGVSLTATTTITIGGSNSFDSLSLTSGGAISQIGGSITINGSHSLTMTSGGVINLSSTNNALTKIGTVRSRGAITIRNQGSDLILSGAINSNWNQASGRDELGSANPIVIDLGNGRDLSIDSALTTSGGSVTITSRKYTNNGFEWNLSGNRLTAFVTDKSAISQTGTVFSRVSHLDGNLITFGDPNIVHYFTSDLGDDFTATQASLSEIDPTAVLHDWSDFDLPTPAGLALVGDRIAYSVKGQSPYALVPIGFYNLRLKGTVPQFGSSQIIVRGVNRIYNSLDLATMPLLVLASDGVLTVPTLTLGNNGAIDFGPNGRLNSDQIIANGANGVGFYRTDPFNSEPLVITSQLTISGELRVITATDFSAKNPLNRIANLTLQTNGNRIYYNGRVSGIMDATTHGGSITVNVFDSLNLVTHWVGAVGFKVEGSLSLSGGFGWTSGRAQSVSIDGDSISVYGTISSDTGINIGGKGSAILAGELVGNSVITIDQPLTVATPSTVIAQNGGAIVINSRLTEPQVDSNLMLVLNATGLGKVILDEASGSLNLGWITVITSQLSNPQEFLLNRK
ncbi:MAG: hypothetical protein QM523_11375, partial [Candidatus Pacebacteria bacterium]|nr:hypothetical protein [Candidatus Paceibacterota bacterium]